MTQLLNRAQLLAVKAASTEATRPQLNGLHIAPNGVTTASDGHCMIRVTPAVLDTTDYPVAADWIAPTIPPEGMIVPTATALAALKAIPKARKYGGLEVLQNVLVASVNGHVELSTTDLDTTKREQGPLIDFPYPDCDRVIPHGEPVFSIGFDAVLLGDLLKTLASMKLAGMRNPVNLHFYAPLSACKITATTENGDSVVALAMPLRIAD